MRERTTREISVMYIVPQRQNGRRRSPFNSSLYVVIALYRRFHARDAVLSLLRLRAEAIFLLPAPFSVKYLACSPPQEVSPSKHRRRLPRSLGRVEVMGSEAGDLRSMILHEANSILSALVPSCLLLERVQGKEAAWKLSPGSAFHSSC